MFNHQVLLDSWYQDKKHDEAAERLRIVRTAAAIISEDISTKIYDTDNYPNPEKFLDTAEDDVPETLKIFLKEVILKHKRKSRDKYQKQCTVIAHSIIAATRSRSFCLVCKLGLQLSFIPDMALKILLMFYQLLCFIRRS